MNLPEIETSLGKLERLKLKAATWVQGERAPDVLRVIFFKPWLFGRPFVQYVQAVLRGSGPWCVGERELLATAVSFSNGCRYCSEAHRAMATQALGESVVAAALAEQPHPDLDRRLAAAVAFVVKLARSPNDVEASDIDTLRKAGLGDDAIEHTVHICAVMCTINRIADALQFQVPSARGFSRLGAMLLRVGYRVV